MNFRLQKSKGMACEKIEEKKKQIEMKKRNRVKTTPVKDKSYTPKI